MTVWKIQLGYLLFGISGACALGYELVWTRQFGMRLGHELPGVLSVVAAFFGGVSLGAFALDKRVSRSPNPGLWYAGLELVIGLWGFLTHILIPSFTDQAVAWIDPASHSAKQWTISFVLPFVLLLPATTAMGATFPAMERFLSQLGSTRSVGGLYAANTLGAVTGILATTFLILPAFGFRQTLLGLAMVNLACASLAFLLAKKRPIASTRLPGMSADPAIGRRTIFGLGFAAGLLGIGFEVLGIRVLAEVLENTIYTFAAVLSVFLMGTALGAAVYQRRGARWHLAWPFYLFSGTALACLFSAWPLAHAQTIYDWARRVAPENTIGVLGAEMVLSALVFALPTLCMGATFSWIVQSARGQQNGVGTAVAFNTLGSALAPFLVGVIAFPTLGPRWTILTLALGYLFLAWQSLPNTPGDRRNSLNRLVLPTAAVIALALIAPAQLYHVRPPPGGQLLEYRPGVMDSVAVVRHFDGHRSLLVNNRFIMGGTGAAAAAKRHGHIPLLLHPSPRKALFLGMGTGISFSSANFHPNLQADAVELIPEVIGVMSHFSPENSIRSGMTVHLADARRFVRSTQEQYDVIVADLFHPAREGAGTLYTLEHFRAIKNRLAENGLFCQWLPLFQMDQATIRTVTATLLDVFPHVRAYVLRFNIDTPVLGLIATSSALRYPPNWITRRVADESLRQHLRSLGLADEFQLFGCFLAEHDALQQFAQGAPLNTDDHPIVMFRAPEFIYRRAEPSYGRLLALLEQLSADATTLVDPSHGPTSSEFVVRLNRFMSARDTYIIGLAREQEAKTSEAISLFLQSVQASADFTTAYAHCLTIAIREWPANREFARDLLSKLTEARPERPVAKQLLDRLEAETK